jgi:hypothetical protein
MALQALITLLLLSCIVALSVLYVRKLQGLDSPAAPPRPPAAVAEVRQTDDEPLIIIEWDASEGATSYIVTILVQEDTDNTSFTKTERTVGAGTTTLTLTQDKTFAFPVSVTAVNAAGRSAPTFTFVAACFVAGTHITLADGTTAPIEAIRVGDAVRGAFGEINTVLGLQHLSVGRNRMVRLGGDHITTSHHAHVAPDRTFWAVDAHAYDSAVPAAPADDASCVRAAHGRVAGTAFLLQDALGRLELRTLDGFRKGRSVTQLKAGCGTTLQRHGKPFVIDTIEEVVLPSSTPLFNLRVSNSHTYCADGFAVTGWPSEVDFCYDAWQPKPCACAVCTHNDGKSGVTVDLVKSNSSVNEKVFPVAHDTSSDKDDGVAVAFAGEGMDAVAAMST